MRKKPFGGGRIPPTPPGLDRIITLGELITLEMELITLEGLKTRGAYNFGGGAEIANFCQKVQLYNGYQLFCKFDG